VESAKKIFFLAKQEEAQHLSLLSSEEEEASFI
jgi:hypothetical protein